MKRIHYLMFAVLLVSLFVAQLTGCSQSNSAEGEKSLASLNSPKTIIAVESGTIAEKEIQPLLPDAKYLYVNSPTDGYLAVQTGKATAYAGDQAIFNNAMREGLTGLKGMDEVIGDDGKVAVGISPVSAIDNLENLTNAFLQEMEAQGVLDDMYQRWVVEGDYTMPDIERPQNPARAIKIGTTGLLEPYTFYSGTELTGYEMEMMRRFALWANADIEVLTYDWGGIIPACAAGKVDLIMSNLFDTDERDETIMFSNPYIRITTAIIIPDTSSTQNTSTQLPTLKDLNGKSFAVVTGTLLDDYAHTYFDKSPILYFNNATDMIAAVVNKKADALLLDEPVARLAARNNSKLAVVEELVLKDDYAYAAPKTAFGDQLTAQMSEFVVKLRADGTLQKLKDVWLGDDESAKTIGDWKHLPAKNGTVRFVTMAQVEPFAYYKGSEIIGYDIDILVQFCEAYGYGLEITDTAAGTWMAGLTGGKYDLAAAAISVTEERKKSVSFSEPNYNGGIVAVVAIPDGSTATATTSSARFMSVHDFEGAVIGTQTGTMFDKILSGQIENLSYKYFDDFSSVVLSLEKGMVDAVGMDEPVAKLTVAQKPELAIFPAVVQTDQYGFALQKDSPLTEKISAIINDLEMDGTLQQLQNKWFGADESIKKMDVKPIDPASSRGTLRYAHDSTISPMAYVGDDGSSLGYEVELAALFAQKLGMKLELIPTNFSSLINMLQSGKADLASGAMSITDERRQSVDFPVSHYIGGIVLVVQRQDLSAAATVQPEFDSPSALSAVKAKMGVRTGSIQDAYTKQYLPETSILYFDDISDMIAALNTKKIDGFMTTTPRVPFILKENSNLSAFELQGPVDDVAFMVARTAFGKQLLDQLNTYITSSRQSGLFDDIYDAWFNATENYPVVVEPSSLPATNGTIRYAAQGNTEPISFNQGSTLTGFEIDLLTRFAKQYGYGLTITESNITGMLAGITGGKYDVAGGALAITEERRKSIDFTESYYSYGQWIIVRNRVSNSPAAALDTTSVLDKLASSFYKNFVKENRWKLLASGIGVTLIISILSAILGTLFGFGMCFVRMSKNQVFAGFAKAFIQLIQGVPLVVLLMILYYVVFGSVDINAMVVAVIGISINFGVYVSEMMRTGIEAVPKGQTEASLALGYNGIQTFQKIIFPQAARHVLPVYKGEFISMVKVTSIVGYIAIQDLTKVSDIIRSRTYEAFFPLIVTAVIYFLIATSLTSLLNLVEIKIDPKRRSRNVKGVIEE